MIAVFTSIALFLENERKREAKLKEERLKKAKAKKDQQEKKVVEDQ